MTSPIDAEMSAGAALRAAGRLLADRGIATATTDARLLTQHALGLSSLDLALGRPARIGADGARTLTEVVERRRSGEPVARILRQWEFWGLSFALSPATLVPRPDTETLVERALAQVPDRERPLRLLDLGTGSGCILIALLHELPNAFGIGLDRSSEALETARTNAEANGVGRRAGFVRGEWCGSLRGPFDLIVSNPPYIASAVIGGLDPEVRLHDPGLALDGGADGLDAYRAILSEIAARPGLIAADGAVLLEIGYDQAEPVLALGESAGFTGRDLDRDLAGQCRVVTLRPPFGARSDRS